MFTMSNIIKKKNKTEESNFGAERGLMERLGSKKLGSHTKLSGPHRQMAAARTKRQKGDCGPLPPH